LIEQVHDIHPEKSIERCGGTAAAIEVLSDFIDNLSDYPGNISSPTDARSGTSQLSPYLRFGCLSVRQVYQRVRDCSTSGRAEEMFVSRLYWNRHYNQKLADWHGWMDTAVNPVLEDFHADSHDPDLVDAWKHGQTGYPMVDASMRCLKETGWLNFRMRAMCASMLCDLMQQPWKLGADWFYYHLLDADPAINYTQFQLQAGVDGTNMMRIYNPRKQARDNDPNGEFIHKWVPELQSLPVKYLDQPEKTPVSVQNEVGVSIGDDYPYPIVEYEQARHDIIEKIEQVRDAAHEALHHPEVNRRASLSQRGGTTTVEDIGDIDSLREQADSGGQSSLNEFC
jgi:deoxyribodipyrimidine photo-lyase